jgi:LacI family transcriptional regulator
MTQKDIARMLRVSPATVSMALRNESNISPAVRERVLELVRKHRVPLRARSAESKDGSTATLRIGYCSAPFADGWLHAGAYRGMSDRYPAQPHEVMLFISVTPHGQSRENAALEIKQQVAAAKLDGLIVDAERGLLNTLESLSLPRVAIGYFNAAPESLDAVVPDNVGAGYKLTRELIAQGHRRIAWVRCNPRDFNSREKYQGHLMALSEAGIPFEKGLILDGDFSWMSGAHCAQAIAKWKQPPAAVLLENDWMTGQFVQGWRELGKAGAKLLDSVRLAHIVDARRETGLSVEIDRIELRTIDMGRIAARLLIDRITGRATGAPVTIKVSAEFLPTGPRIPTRAEAR